MSFFGVVGFVGGWSLQQKKKTDVGSGRCGDPQLAVLVDTFGEYERSGRRNRSAAGGKGAVIFKSPTRTERAEGFRCEGVDRLISS